MILRRCSTFGLITVLQFIWFTYRRMDLHSNIMNYMIRNLTNKFLVMMYIVLLYNGLVGLWFSRSGKFSSSVDGELVAKPL